MTLTVSRGEGLTVINVTSNPKSKWPVLCQILGFLCYSPVCSVSQGMKGKLKDLLTALGIVQMCIGVLNIAMGIVFTCTGLYFTMYLTAQGPFWLGSLFLLSGILCILAVKFPTSSLLIMGIIMNGVNVALVFITMVVYTVDLTNGHNEYRGTCDYYSRYDYGTPSPEESRRKEMCLSYKNGIVQMIIGVLNIAVGIAFTCLSPWYTMDRIAQGPFWIGSVVITGMILNIVGTALAITAIVLYSVDLANDHTGYCESYNSNYYSRYDYGYGYETPSSEISRRQEICQYYRNLTETMFKGLDIMMIVLSVLQLCVTISFCVLTGKALCKKDEDAKTVQIIVGVTNIVVGIVFLSFGFCYSLDPSFQRPFWLSTAFLVGIVCIPGAKFQYSCLLVVTMILKIIFIELDIVIVVLTVIQLCVIISFCVWTGEALCKKDEDAKLVGRLKFITVYSMSLTVSHDEGLTVITITSNMKSKWPILCQILGSCTTVCMLLTMSQSEGMMVITITSNPKSKWPPLCLILSSLCYGPVCFASEDVKEKLTDTQRVIGMIQIVVGVMNLVLGCFGIIYFLATSSVNSLSEGMMVITITSNPKSKWPPLCLILSSLCYGPVCFASEDVKEKLTDTQRVIGMIQIVVGVMNLVLGCFGIIYFLATSSVNSLLVEKTILETKSGISHNTKDSMTDSMTPALSQIILGGLDIMMIVLSVVQLCVTITFCVLTGKALCKKDEDEKLDPELYQPLLEDDTAGAA
ncbi:transmembrane protein 176A-like [Labeo rohita]|uniref:Transmembrane protein 176A-like n=1 Tax=Labeo rohita TaxID=84645 RepID=A0A498P2I8_LABRO|nr:transmembrane protein 176A-like [Labeo rohita]